MQIKKFRQKYHKFLVEGDKIVRELLENPEWRISELYALEPWIRDHGAGQEPGTVFPVTEEELKRISAMQTPNQVLAVVDKRETREDPEVLQKDLSIYLDGIQDPGNLGAILRIADWFGIRHVILSPETVEVYNPKVIQASMGAFLRVEFPVLEIQELRNKYPEVRIFGADLEGQDVFDHEASPGIGMLLVIGNEGNGISDPVREILEGRLTIPPAATASGAESLNAAVAAGVLCAVLRRAYARDI
ncbi:MAG: RNA methyltransferase [Haliscomenobacter sp.]|nr:RNA methyltransferase [Haliscomenobacter sp.]MBK7474499.1 RNA methyltransferase [Haliscomenobacter sp.]